MIKINNTILFFGKDQRKKLVLKSMRNKRHFKSLKEKRGLGVSRLGVNSQRSRVSLV